MAIRSEVHMDRPTKFYFFLFLYCAKSRLIDAMFCAVDVYRAIFRFPDAFWFDSHTIILCLSSRWLPSAARRLST